MKIKSASTRWLNRLKSAEAPIDARQSLYVLAVVLLNTGCNTWRAVNDPVFEGAELYAVAKNRERLVAVGLSYNRYVPSPDYDAAVWTSTDGRRWTRIPHSDSVFGGTRGQAIRDVIWNDSLFVGGGVDWSGGDADVAFWTSPDGLNWTRIRHNERVFGGRGNQIIAQLGVGPAGTIAIGQSLRSGAADVADPAAWYSVNGLKWSLVVLDEPAKEAQVQLPHSVVVDRAGGSLFAEIVGYDAANAGSCGQWGVRLPPDSALRLAPGLSTLDLCASTSSWQRYPVRVAQHGGYTYAVVRSQSTDASGAPVVHSILASPAEGGWATLNAFSDAVFVNVFGDGEFDGSFAVVGNAGDLNGMTAWIWRVGDEERTDLPHVVRQGRVTSYAYDVTEFRGIPLAVGFDVIGSMNSVKRARGIAWYRGPGTASGWGARQPRAVFANRFCLTTTWYGMRPSKRTRIGR